MNRRPATAQDMTVGAIVFKGKGKTEWVVVGIHEVFWAPGKSYPGYEVKQVGTTSKPKNAYLPVKHFTVTA